MLSTISWASYIQTVTGLLVIYYLLVVYVYYRQEFLRLFSRRQLLFTKDANDLHQNEPVQYLMDEISALISQATYSRSSKPEIIFSLQQIVKKYPGIRGSAFQNSVNQLIEFECKDKCGIHLSEDEVRQVWLV